MDGYIKLHRKILDNPIVCKDAEYFAVWNYLLLNATHKEIPMLFKGEKIILKPGQLITGRNVIAEQFNISESKVRRILNSFENDQQIDRQRSNKNSLITILNWNEYQASDQQDDQQVTNKRPTSDQQVTTNKNVKNVKNIYKENRAEYEKKYSPDSFEIKCVDYLIKSIKEELPSAKVPTDNEQIDKWCNVIEKMVRLDKHSQDDIYSTLVFARTDNFWKINIRSTSKFREKYETLYLQMKNKKNIPQMKPKTNSQTNYPQREYSKNDYEEHLRKLTMKGM